MKIEVELPTQTLRDLDDLARRKNISRTEALIQSVETTKELVQKAPNGARIVPLSKTGAAVARRRG